MMRRLEMIEDGSSKFWEVEVDASAMTVRYGRIGTAGQTKRSELESPAAAERKATKLLRQKTSKGYVEVGASSDSPTEAPAPAKAPAKPAKAAKKAPAAPAASATPPNAQPASVEGPSSTPRSGRRTWLLAPGGGRDWLGIDLHEPTEVVGIWAVSWRRDGRVVRVDLSTCERVELGRVAPPKQGTYRAIAISADGAHWAVTDGQTTVVDGKAIEGELSHLVFAEDGGALWGFRGQRAVKLTLDGQLLFEGSHRGSLLALAGDAPVVGVYAAVFLPDDAGGFVRVSATPTEEPKRLLVGASHAVLLFWLQHEGKWCWRASVFSLADHTERTFPLEGCDGFATIADGRMIWVGGELELATGALSTFDVTPLGSKHAQKRYGGITVSPDGTTLWQVLLDASCVRRFQRADRSEAPLAEHHPAQKAWSLAVSPGGNVAVGTDTGWVLYAATGEKLHQSDEAQAVQLAFSPDGARLAVATTEPALLVVDVASLQTLVRAKRGATALAFLPDGERMLLVDEGDVMLIGAGDLRDQAALRGKSPMRRAAAREGAIVAADENGRAYVFDDPGPLPPAKKAPKFPPRVLIPSPDLPSFDGISLELSAGHLVVSGLYELRAIDLGSRKVVMKSDVGPTFGDDGILAIPSGPGTSLYRLGERHPFTTLEGMPERIAATADGRCVVVALHRGILLWREETGRTPDATSGLVLPGAAGPVPLPLAGFSGETRAFVVHGFAAQVPGPKAEALARDITDTFPSWVAVPEGDPRGGAPEQILTLFVGVVVAEAEADGVQGRKGPKASFTAEAFARAAARVLEAADAVRARLAIDATSIEAPSDHVVATGGLSSAALSMGDASVQLGWEGEQSASLPKRAAGTLVCWYD